MTTTKTVLNWHGELDFVEELTGKRVSYRCLIDIKGRLKVLTLNQPEELRVFTHPHQDENTGEWFIHILGQRYRIYSSWNSRRREAAEWINQNTPQKRSNIPALVNDLDQQYKQLRQTLDQHKHKWNLTCADGEPDWELGTAVAELERALSQLDTSLWNWRH